MNRLNLNIPINSLGYGVVGYNIWKGLSKFVDTTLFNIGNITPPCKTSEEEVTLIRKNIEKQSDFKAELPTLKVWHENQLAERIGSGKYFAFPFFEVNQFDNRRKSHLLSADEIIVASEWAKDIIKDQLYKSPNGRIYLNADMQIHVVPCGVDRNIFNETGNKSNTSKCIFFNCGKWEVRKGHDILHKAFKDAFPFNPDVELWMMTENPFLQPQEKATWESMYAESRVKLIPRVQYQEQLAEIISKTFCGVFPARAEGWNLELLEMMSMGKHVITTNYSAHTQFCNNENSNLIEIAEEETAYDGKWFLGDVGTWASLEGSAYDQLVEHLRSVYAMWKASPDSINEEGIETSKNLSWDNTNNKIASIIFGGDYNAS